MLFRLLIILLLVGVVVRPTLGQTETAKEGDIVLTEIMYAPEGTDSDREYVEVFNTTDRAIDLDGWTMFGEPPEVDSPRRDDIEGVVVESGQFVVLCENGDAAENGGVDCAFDYANRINLTNTADYVGLRNEEGERIDHVGYDEEAGWPDAVGASIEFVGAADEDNNRPAAWKKATARVGDFAEQSGLNQGSPNANAPDGALPVELARFEVRAADGGARLRWTTASEAGTAGFEIQRRGPATRSWTREGFVDGHGTTTDAQRYQFDVNRLRPGTHRFRLRQVDLDGTSQIVADEQVRIQAEVGLTLHGPNPVPGGRAVPVTLRPVNAETVDVALYDALGRRLRPVDVRNTGAELARARVPTTGLATGTYFVRAQGGGLNAVAQLTVVQ